MATETPVQDGVEIGQPIDKGNLYEDLETGLYVRVSGLYVDEDGETQIKIRQYTGYPTATHNSCAYDDIGYAWRLTIDVDTFFKRIASGELRFIE